MRLTLLEEIICYIVSSLISFLIILFYYLLKDKNKKSH